MEKPRYDVPYGTTVEVCNITDESDRDLNGRVGILVSKWSFNNHDPRLTFGDIGIVILEGGSKLKANLKHGEYRALRPLFHHVHKST